MGPNTHARISRVLISVRKRKCFSLIRNIGDFFVRVLNTLSEGIDLTLCYLVSSIFLSIGKPYELSYISLSLSLSLRDFLLQCMNTPSQEGDTYQEHMYTLVPQVKIGLFMDDKNSNSNARLVTTITTCHPILNPNYYPSQ